MAMPQLGAQHGVHITETVVTLQWVLQRATHFGNAVYIVKIDLMQAFDHMDVHALWQALTLRKAPLKLKHAMMEMMRGEELSIVASADQKTPGKVLRKRGLPQGGPHSMAFFEMALDAVMSL